VHDFLQQPIIVVVVIEKQMRVDFFVPFPILLLLVAVALSVRLVGSMIPHRAAAVACGGTGGGGAGHDDDDGKRQAQRGL